MKFSLLSRYIIKATQFRNKLRDFQIEMDIVAPVIICVIIGGSAAIIVFSLIVIIVNNLLK